MAIITLNNNSLSSVTSLPAGVGGKVLQVVTSNKLDTQSFTGNNSHQAITDLSVAITPSSTSNKILITSTVNLAVRDHVGGISIFRGGSQLVNASGSLGSRVDVNSSQYIGSNDSHSNINVTYLDSPSSTSELTYQTYIYARSTTYYINRSTNDTDNNDHARTISTITAMEIAG